MPDAETTEASDQTDAARLGLNYVEFLASRDVAGLTELFAPDAQWELRFQIDGVRPVFVGKTQISKLIAKVLGAQLDTVRVYDVEVTNIAPDLALVEWRTQCTTADGGEYSNAYAVKLTSRDGLIWRWREYFDPRPVQAQLL